MVMPIVNPDLVNLILLDMEPLSLDESFEALLDGEVLVIKEYEKTRRKDVLVKLDRRKYPVTYISYDSKNTHENVYWEMHNVSINSLALHTVVRYDPLLSDVKFSFTIGDVVQIDKEDEVDIDFIDAIWINEDRQIYYTLNKEEGYFHESELEFYC